MGLSNAIQPPPLPNTPRPPMPIPHHHQSYTANGEHSPHQSPTPSSGPRLRGYPSYPHRDLPPPPLPNRSVSPSSTSARKSGDTPPPLPPNRPSSPTGMRDSAPSPPNRPATRWSRPPQRPPLPQRHSQESVESVTPPPSGPVLPPRHFSRTPNPHPKPNNPQLHNKPPPGGSRPKPPPPRKPHGLSSSTSPPPHSMERSSDSLGDKIQRLLTEAPEIISAVQDGYGTVPQLLEDLASLTESIVDSAQEGPNDSTVSFRMCITKIRSQMGILRDCTNAQWQNNAEKIHKAIESIIQQVNKLSSHLR